MKLTLVGAGPGSPRFLTEEGRRALEQADCLIGAPRLLEGVESRAPRFPMTRPEEIASFLEEHREFAAPCLLFSGDTGFYSGARSLLARLKGWETSLVPGLSSLQYFAARLGSPWQEWRLVSAHGLACDPVPPVRRNRFTFFLTGGASSPASLCRALAAAGLGQLRAAAGADLSYPQEEIAQGLVRELAERDFPPLSVLLVENSAPSAPLTPGVPDEEFLRGKVPMTKREVRSLALCSLGLQEGSVFWDIGAGTGSVAVEAALLGCAVYAVEQKDEACGLIRRNAEKFHVSLQLRQGAAPQACQDLPAPDAAFVGGSGGRLEEILLCLLEKNPAVRVAVSAVTVETLAEASALLDRLGFLEVRRIQAAVSLLIPAGRYHRMEAQNPVFLLSGRGPGA